MYKKITVITQYCKVPDDVTLEDILAGTAYQDEYSDDYDEYNGPYYDAEERWSDRGVSYKKPLKFKKAMKYKAGKAPLQTSNVFSSVSNENTDIGVKLRLTSREFFERYADLLRSYIVSKTSNLDDAAKIRSLIAEHNKTIGNIVFSWYRPENVATFSNAFNTLSLSVCDVIDAKTSNTDIAASMATFMINVIAFGQALNGLNAFGVISTWPEDGIKDIFSNLMNSLIRQIDSRASKDWDGDQASAKLTVNILSTGLPTGMAGFADVLSKGIITQNPWRFTL